MHYNLPPVGAMVGHVSAQGFRLALVATFSLATFLEGPEAS